MGSFAPHQLIQMQDSKRSRLNLFLVFLAAVQLANVTWYALSLANAGYLPAPFIFDKNNTFMDLYNPMYWATDQGRYTDWKSIYPPLNFVVLGELKALFFGSAHYPSGYSLRDSGQLLSLAFILMAVACCSAIIQSSLFARLSGYQKLLLLVIIVLSPPFLFAIERGNLVLLALPILAVAVVTTGWRRALCIAVLINIKPYFVVMLLSYMVKGRFEWALFTAAVAGAIFATTGLLVDPHFLQFFANLQEFRQVIDSTHPGNFIVMSSSIDVIRYSLDYWIVDGIDFGGFERDLKSASNVLGYALKISTFGLVVVCFLAGSRISYRESMFASLLIVLNLSLYAGGYALIFLIPFLPTIWNLRFSRMALLLTVVMILPLDWIPIFTGRDWPLTSYLTGEQVPVVEVFGLSAILRPMADFGLMLLLTVELGLRMKTKIARIEVPQMSVIHA